MALTITPNVNSIDSKTGTLTATNILDTIKTVDGALSALDADLLDGQHGTYYQQALVSGTNIKTINGNSVLGSGDLVIAGSQKTRTEIIATAGQTVFSIAYNTTDVTVLLNGVLLAAADYTAINGTSITLTLAASVNDILTVITYLSLVNFSIRENVLSIATNTTAIAFNTYVLTASCTLTLPLSPTIGDWIKIHNRSTTITAVIARNGSNIMGLAENMTIDNLNGSFVLTYVNATTGWSIL